MARKQIVNIQHLRSGLGFSARVVNNGLVLHRLFSCHRVKYRGELIDHVEETLPVRATGTSLVRARGRCPLPKVRQVRESPLPELT
jgi:hypothetical protein